MFFRVIKRCKNTLLEKSLNIFTAFLKSLFTSPHPVLSSPPKQILINQALELYKNKVKSCTTFVEPPPLQNLTTHK